MDLADFPVYAWRYTLLMGIASVYWLERERLQFWQDPQLKSKVESILPADQGQMSLWGEGAVPQFLFHQWYVGRSNEGSSNDMTVSLANKIISIPLFSVYYDAEEIIRHQLSETFEAFNSRIKQRLPNKAQSSYFSKCLILHLVQRGLEEPCQVLWPPYTKITSLVFVPKMPWMYCLWRSEEGDNHSFRPPETGHWSELVAESEDGVHSFIPGSLAERPLLLALWCISSAPPSHAGCYMPLVPGFLGVRG